MSDTAITPIGWAGDYKDTETGYVYLRARYYDPATAQFLTRDPMEALTRSAYGYVNNNPINATDPTGLWCLVHNDDGGCKGARAIEQHADDVSNVAGGVAIVCGGITALAPNPVTGGCAAAAATVNVTASALHTAVTCANWDKYCRNSAAATALNLATAGTGNAFFRYMRSRPEDELLILGAMWWQGSWAGWMGGLMINTTERPKDC